jgi:hypothetical protein
VSCLHSNFAQGRSAAGFLAASRQGAHAAMVHKEGVYFSGKRTARLWLLPPSLLTFVVNFANSDSGRPASKAGGQGAPIAIFL